VLLKNCCFLFRKGMEAASGVNHEGESY